MVATVALVAILLTACDSAQNGSVGRTPTGSHPSGQVSNAQPGRPSPTHPQDHETAYRPVAGASQPTGPALNVGGEMVTLDGVRAVSAAGRSRQHGEATARDIAKIVMDAPTDVTGEEFVTAMAALQLPAEVREYLIWDIDGQRAMRSARRYDLSVGGFYRSSIEGRDSSPTRVSLEIAAVVIAEGSDIRFWYATRWDVAWEDKAGWRLIDYSDGSIGPETNTLTQAQQRKYLTGSGWRPLAQ